MYNAYFGFSESPFENNLDQRFLFPSEDHKEVLAALLYFVKTRKGFAIVCGDVGTGKTMVINCLLDRLPHSVAPIIIANPLVNSLEILQYIAKTLKIKIENDNILELTDKVKTALIEAKDKGKKQFILIIDEAHLLSGETLEDIRLLSNIETPDQKLLQILLIGQYELSYRLDRPEMRHLRQRINVNRFLSPLSPGETVQYIEHRLRLVGSSFTRCFEDQCKGLIFKMTKGVPRRINQLCDNSLLICMAERKKKVDVRALRKADEALRTDKLFTPRSFAGRKLDFRFPRIAKILAPVALASILFILGGYFGASGWLGKKAKEDHPLQLSQDLSSSKQKMPSPEVADPFPSQGRKEPAGAGAPAPGPMAELSKPASPSAPRPAGADSPSATSISIEPRTPPDPARRKEADVKDVSPGPPLKENRPSPTDELREEVAQTPSEPPLSQEPLSKSGNLASRAPESPPLTPSPTGPAKASPYPRQLAAKKGDVLGAIAVQHYSQNPGLGLEAIILANPEITNKDLIHQGQNLFLPKINFSDGSIQLRDNLFYAYYGRYPSPQALQKDKSRFLKNKIGFKVMKNKDAHGVTTYLIILGGYEKVDDLLDALKTAKAKS